MHLWKSGRIGSLEVKGDCILGHEAAGIVLKCGEGVTSLKPGKSIPRLLASSYATTKVMEIIGLR